MNHPNLAEIEHYIETKLCISGISITDDSHLHHTHQNFQQSKAYLTITIPKALTISRLTLHRRVMQYAKEICNQPIHAIAIHVL